MIQLRPYQQVALDALRSEIRAKRDPIFVSPCGSGKGSLIAYMVHRAVERGHKVIFAVHGKSLVIDMSERIKRLGVEHGVLMGGVARDRRHAVQVASIDTLHRMEYPPDASIIIADEADGAMSPTWRKTLAKYPDARLIGMTATPVRLDGKGLGKKSGGLFDSIVMGPTELDLIEQGYLVGSRVLAPRPPADLGNLKKVAGEFDAKQQAAIMDTGKVCGDLLDHWRKYAYMRKTAAFGVNKEHAAHITDTFRGVGIQWAYVDDKTSREERARIWHDLDHGCLMGVSSVGVTTVGWDHPVVSCLIVARKTTSLRLHKQILGRGSRPYPGKDHFIVLDHVGNTHYHDPYGLFEQTPPWSLDEGVNAAASEDKKKVASVATCTKCYYTFKSGPTNCPSCGAAMPVRKQQIEQVDGELQEITLAGTAEQREKNERILKRIYETLRARGVEKGYKPNYAPVAFKNAYGMWPKREWRA